MSDFLASSTAPESQFTGSEFDVTSIDRNLRAIQGVEGKWRLPTLPDEVKLDLASYPGVDADSLTDLLLGIDADLNEVEEEPAPEPLVPPFVQPRTAMDLARVYAAGITQSREPTEVTQDAVKRFKYEAMERGYLPQGTTLDSTWSPEYNSLRREMLFDDYNQNLAGDRPGAVPTNKVIEQIGKWTSPTGLLAAATELDLFWDFNAIGDEWSTWGDKWRKVADSKNPFDFAKNLVDAATGPIDDVVLPALNLTLLATGVGAMANGARIGVMGGARIARGGKLLEGLYSGVLRPSSVGQLAEASWTATKLMNSAGAGRQLLGQGLAAWRALPVVPRVKQGMQVGMRLGIMSQAQDLLPGYQGGVDLTDLSPGLDQAAEGMRQFGMNSPLSTPLELALAPWNIFNPGTFVGSSGALSRTARGLWVAGGNTAGRAVAGALVGAGIGTLAGDDAGDVAEGMTYGALAAGLLPHAAGVLGRAPDAVKSAALGAGLGAGVAVVTDSDPFASVGFGAATGASLVGANSIWSRVPNPSKYVGYVTDTLSKFSYRPIAEDQRLASAFQSGIRRAFAENPEQLRQWDERFRRNNSLLKTVAETFGTDEEGAAAAMTYVYVSAAIDHTARAQAAEYGGGLERFHQFRNKLIAQLRTFDPESQFLPDEIARAMAIDKPTTADYERVFQRSMSQLDQDSARVFVEQHNALAAKTLQQLLSPTNMPDLEILRPWTGVDDAERMGVLENYVLEALPTFGNWPKFTTQTQQVSDWVVSGRLDNAGFVPVKTPFGTLREPKAGLAKVNDRMTEVDEEVMDAILRNPAARVKTAGRLAPLARLQPTGRFTVARADTITKQALEEEAYRLDDVISAFEKLDYLNKHGVMAALDNTLRTTSQRFEDIPHQQLSDFLRANGLAKNESQLRYIHGYMTRQGIGRQELASMLRERVNALVADSELWAGYKLDPILRNSENVPLEGLAALKARVKQLRDRARYTAAEIDEDSIIRHVRETEGDEAADAAMKELAAMRADGYKLVHGVEYMMPHDLAINTELFRDMGVREANAATLGNAFGRRQPAVARMSQERRERALLVKALADDGLGDLDPDDPMVTQALTDLRSILNEIQDPIAQRVEERHLASFWERKRLALDSTFAPLRLEDLTKRRSLVVDRLQAMGWTPEQAESIFAQIRHFRNTEFKDLGLYAFEAKIREMNVGVSALKFLGGTKYGDQLVNSRLVGAGVGAYAGQNVAVGQLDEDATEEEAFGAKVAGLVSGGLFGAGAVAGAAKVAGRNDWLTDMIAKAEQRPGFMLGDKYVRMRDSLRFALSPLFDISRYTEGLMLGQTGVPLRHPTTGKRIVMPLNMSPTGARKRMGKEAYDAARQEYRVLSRTNGVGDVDLADDAVHWFEQIGIMGFNPQEWQVAAFAELKRQGLSSYDAWHAARETYTYGAQGRSAAELSMNFVFFPFSFQKKALGHVAKFMNDDLGRSILIHDGFAAYQALDEKYNLDEKFRDHIPAMDMLRRLNLLAYGLSPGRFGGINSQLFETMGRSAILFTPVGTNITDETDFIELQKLMRSLTPAYNDLNWMLEEIKQSGGLFSETHQLRSGQIRDGYDEWNTYRRDLARQLEERGYTWSDLNRKPYLADAKLAYEAKRAELASKYPEWKKSREESIFNLQALEMERNDRLARAVSDPATASDDDRLLAAMENEVLEVKRLLRNQGVTVDGPDGWTDAPPWAFDYLLERAVSFQEINPRFKAIWKKFYERELGPIEAKI